jgi:hypothetical protein
MSFSNKLSDGSGLDPLSTKAILDIETKLLSALAKTVAGDTSSLSDEQFRRLAGYRFREGTHQIIFDAICEFRGRDSAGYKAGQETLREHVARRLTLRGFPDVELDLLFASRIPEETPEEVDGWVLRLMKS